MSSARNVVLLDLPSEGAGLYRLDDTLVRMRTFPVPVQKRMRPRQVALGEDDSIVVSGSDHGVVYIFERRDGKVIQELGLKNSGWCQTVLVRNRFRYPNIYSP